MLALLEGVPVFRVKWLKFCQNLMNVRCAAGEALRAGWPPVLALLEACQVVFRFKWLEFCQTLMNVRCVAGEALRAGWPPVLALLEGVPGGGDARAVGAAFQAVQLLAADHLAALPLLLLAPSLRCAALYASQQARTVSSGAAPHGCGIQRQPLNEVFRLDFLLLR